MHQFLALSVLLATATAAPQRNRNGGGRGGQRPDSTQRAAAVPQGNSQATDGSMILDDTVMVKCVPKAALVCLYTRTLAN